MPPLISVIIVCRNPGPQLAEAIGSVQRANCANVEIVVIDGASSDGTAEWLAARRAEIGTVFSEPDTGIYDAMNKGVKLARGDWVLFLGADDRLADATVLSRASDRLTQGETDIAVGEARFSDGRVYAFNGTDHAVRRNFVHHQATFYRRSLFTEHGSFDPGLRLQADYDFNLRVMKAGRRFAPLAFRIAECASGGVSDAGAWENYREEITVRHRHFPFVRSLIWDVGSVIRFVRKRLLRSSKRHG